MDRDDLPDDLLDLGAVTATTKGGPIGFEEAEFSLYVPGMGLAQD